MQMVMEQAHACCQEPGNLTTTTTKLCACVAYDFLLCFVHLLLCVSG